MPENCSPKDCPVSARVDALKEEFNTYRSNSSRTHKEMFDRLNELERAEAAQEKHFETVNESWTSSLSGRKTSGTSLADAGKAWWKRPSGRCARR